MVFHASNFESPDLKSARDSSHVGPELSLNIRRDDLAPFLGGEDAVVKRRAIGVRHTHTILSQVFFVLAGCSFFPPLQGGSIRWNCIPQGFTLGYSLGLPSGAIEGHGSIRWNWIPRVPPWAILSASLRETRA